jgi:hypothetical protein
MKKVITRITIAIIILSAAAIIPFLYFFYDQDISSDITKWGAFGDYIGATLNIIISLASLIILGYLTHELGKDANEKNKEINILLRKIESYDLISAFIGDIKRYKINLYQEIGKIEHDLSRNPQLNLKKNMQQINEFFEFYDDMFYMITSLKTKYDHIFKYNFDSQEFTSLVNHITIVHMDVHDIYLRSKDRTFPFRKMDEKEIFFYRLESDYIKFLSDLQKELKN